MCNIREVTVSIDAIVSGQLNKVELNTTVEQVVTVVVEDVLVVDP